mmetsp:Transcript_24213/g.61590  ORF Transcript_24213/g.61590 Transcript_24213/m.61590 type:complete len:203 (+) Transcript_24213:1758-2366(+)
MLEGLAAPKHALDGDERHRGVGILALHHQHGELPALDELLDQHAAVLAHKLADLRDERVQVGALAVAAHAHAAASAVVLGDERVCHAGHRVGQLRARRLVICHVYVHDLSPGRGVDAVIESSSLHVRLRGLIEVWGSARVGYAQALERLHHLHARRILVKRSITQVKVHVPLAATHQLLDLLHSSGLLDKHGSPLVTIRFVI